MSNSPKLVIKSDNKLKRPAVAFSYFVRFFALGITLAYFIVLLILIIGDNLTRSFIGYAYYWIETGSNSFIDKNKTYENFQIFSIVIKVVLPIAFLFVLSIAYLLPIFLSKSKGFRLFIGIMVLFGAVAFIVIAILLVELKKYFPHSLNGDQTIDLFYEEVYRMMQYNSFLIISIFIFSSLFFLSAVSIFVETGLSRKGYIDLKELTFNRFKSKPLIIKFIDGDITFSEESVKDKNSKGEK